MFNVVDGNLVFNVNASKYNTRQSGDVSEVRVQIESDIFIVAIRGQMGIKN